MSQGEVFRKVIDLLGDELARVYRRDPEWTERFNSGDNQAIADLVNNACRKAGVTPQEYADAVERDPTLEALQNITLTQVIMRASQSTTPKPVENQRPAPWWQFWRK